MENIAEILLARKELPSFIAIDIGGTIEESWQSKRTWFKRHGIDVGRHPKSRSELVKQFDVQNTLYEKMVQEVYNDKNILKHKLVDGAYEALKVLSLHFRIALLSSRNEVKSDITLRWLQKRNVLGFVSEIVFLGDENKIEWCRKFKVRIFIDDDIRHLESPIYESDSILKIHFGQSLIDNMQNNNIISATCWQEVVKIIRQFYISSGAKLP